MKRVFITFVLAVVLGVSIAPAISYAAEESEGFWCAWFGWAARPVGLCEKPAPSQVVEVVTHDTEVVSEVEQSRSSDQAATNTVASEPTIIEYSTTTKPTYQVQNEYVTIEQNGVSERRLDEVIQGVLSYVNSRMQRPVAETTMMPGPDDQTEYVTREYLLKSLDRVSDQISDTRDRVTIQADFNSPTITNGTLLGLTYASGQLAVGTTSAREVLSVDGAVYIAEHTPSSTLNRLYNFGGDLYWNGSVVTSSSTGNWAAAADDAFRLTGGVGIGTSTIDSTLTVDGTARFTGTTTAPLIDAGGSVCDVRAYGAVGDNSTINDDAIAAAIADCPEGGTVFFPMGEFRISEPIVLDRPVTLRGSYSPRWSYSSTPRSSIRADFNSFSGVAMIHVRDRSISGEPEHNNGGRLEYISIDGGSASTDVTGVLFEGLVRDWKLTDVDISQTSGNGFEARVGAGSGNPRGFTIRGLSIYSANIHGFRATALNDTFIDDLLAVGNAERGIYLSSMGETKIANSRAVFNGLTGLYIDGSSNNGGLTFTDFSTDRNDRHGVRIAASGTSTIVFNGLLTRRDGANQFGGGGSETPYAGLAIIGSTTEKVAPVFVSGLAQTVGVDDSGNPPLAPLVGVRVTNAEYVKIDGQLWGVNDAWQDNGGNDFFVIEDDAIVKTGTAGAQELFTNERKWQSTSTDELIFGNRVSIGSTTDTRLFNIVAPEDAGARFRDTTNDVTMDMRVEDFQAFIGTFSNHQMRFQTNNISRLTIDTNGDIGIGTTSPSSKLTVAGVITPDSDNTYSLGNASNRFSEVFAANGVIQTSDTRLKDNVTGIAYGLDAVLALDPVSFTWKDAPTQGTKFGLLAQDVQDILPEIVHEGDDENTTLGIRYTELTAVLIHALQEMWATVTGNQERIKALEARVEQLEAGRDSETAPTEKDTQPTTNDQPENQSESDEEGGVAGSDSEATAGENESDTDPESEEATSEEASTGSTDDTSGAEATTETDAGESPVVSDDEERDSEPTEPATEESLVSDESESDVPATETETEIESAPEEDGDTAEPAAVEPETGSSLTE